MQLQVNDIFEIKRETLGQILNGVYAIDSVHQHKLPTFCSTVEQFHEHNGKPIFGIIGEITCDDPRVPWSNRLYQVMLLDGTKIDAYGDEIVSQ